jgi:hypothetical protein
MALAGALVAALVVAGEAGHQELRVAAPDLGEEVARTTSAQGRRPASMVGDDHLLAADLILEPMRCGHALTIALPMIASLLVAGMILAGCGGDSASRATETATSGSPGVEVNVYLDAGYAAHQRYENGMVAQAQFGGPDPAKIR